MDPNNKYQSETTVSIKDELPDPGLEEHTYVCYEQHETNNNPNEINSNEVSSTTDGIYPTVTVKSEVPENSPLAPSFTVPVIVSVEGSTNLNINAGYDSTENESYSKYSTTFSGTLKVKDEFIDPSFASVKQESTFEYPEVKIEVQDRNDTELHPIELAESTNFTEPFEGEHFQPKDGSLMSFISVLPVHMINNCATTSNLMEEAILPTNSGNNSLAPNFFARNVPEGISEGEVIVDGINNEEFSQATLHPLQVEMYDLLEPAKQNDIILQANPITDVNVPVGEIYPFPCQFCSRKYKLQSSWTSHMRAHERLNSVRLKKHLYKSKMKTKEQEKKEKQEFVCKFCQKIFYESNTLVAHKKHCSKVAAMYKIKITNSTYQNNGTGDSNDYKCSCGKIFGRKSRVYACQKTHDLVKADIKCPVCLRVFYTERKYTLHKDYCIKKFKIFWNKCPANSEESKCKFCPLTFPMKTSLLYHLKAHKRDQLQEFEKISKLARSDGKSGSVGCFMCTETVQTIEELKLHMDNYHKSPHICPVCRSKYDSYVDLARHMKDTHDEATILPAKHWKCSLCDVLFYDSTLFTEHNANYHGTKSLESINSNPSLEQHLPSEKIKRITKKKVPVTQPIERPKRIIVKKEHSNATVSKPESKITLKLYQCQECDHSFSTARSLARHKLAKHKTESRQTEEDDWLMCVHCRRMCPTSEKMALHMRLHSSDRKFQCKYCGFRFQSMKKLRNHELLHKGSLRYVCFICEYRCSSVRRLNAHQDSQQHKDNQNELLYNTQSVHIDLKLSETVKKKRLSKESNPLEDFPSVHDNLSNSLNISETPTVDKFSEIAKDFNTKVCENDKTKGGRSFACNVCEQLFPSETAMNSHKFATHPFIEFPNGTSQNIIFFK